MEDIDRTFEALRRAPFEVVETLIYHRCRDHNPGFNNVWISRPDIVVLHEYYHQICRDNNWTPSEFAEEHMKRVGYFRL